MRGYEGSQPRGHPGDAGKDSGQSGEDPKSTQEHGVDGRGPRRTKTTWRPPRTQTAVLLNTGAHDRSLRIMDKPQGTTETQKEATGNKD